jgi:prefoldin subunit 5
MKNKVIFYSVVILLIVAVSFFGFRYYKIKSTMGTITPLLQNVSLRVTNDARYEYESTKITYKELFEKIEKDLSEIESKIIDIQSLPTIFCEDKISVAISYAQSCQELLRTLLNKNRKFLAVQSALEWNKKAFNLYLGSISYGGEYAKKTFDEASSDVKTKIQEFKEASQDISTAIKKVEDARKKSS